MRRYVLRIRYLGLIVGVLALTSVFIISSCNQDNSGSLTNPDPVVPDQVETFRDEQGSADGFWASLSGESLKVNIPNSGDYRLLYATNLGTSSLVFRVIGRSLMTVELISGSQVQEAFLQKGTISETSTQMSQALEVFQDANFEVDPSFGNLVLINGGEVARPKPTPTPTPTPQPTPTPPPRPGGPVTYIAAVGNSITYGNGSSRGGYPASLEAKLWAAGHNAVVNNKGVPGEQSPGTDDRFEDTLTKKDIVLLMIGTNDVVVSHVCPDEDCQTIDHIESMIDKALDAGVTPVVSTIIPAKTDDGYSDRNPEIQQLNKKIKDLAGKKNVKVVDNYNAITSNGGDSLYADRLHPNDEGYEVMADEWYRAIRNLVN